MGDFKVISSTSAFLTGRLGFLNQRHDLMTQNLAHLETPHYIGKELNFEGFMKREDSKSPVEFTPKIALDESQAPVNSNGNNVNMEQEMANLSNNSMEYMTAIEILKKNLALMKISVADK